MAMIPMLRSEQPQDDRWAPEEGEDGGELRDSSHHGEKGAPGWWKAECESHARPSPHHPSGHGDMENEARGLLNVIVLVSHCLRIVVGTEDERRQWRAEIAAAAEQLERLRSAGTGQGVLAISDANDALLVGPAALPGRFLLTAASRT